MKQDGYSVYIHKNKINGKIYVGITSQKPEQRWRNGTNYYGNQYFNRAIKKYGWDNFEHSIIYSDLTKTEAEEIEIQLITIYNSTNRSKGYNIENGGNTKGKHSQETINKISESQKGEKNHMYGKTGYSNSRSKEVICLNNKIIYASAYEANRNINTKTSVAECCNGRKKYAGMGDKGEKLLWMWYSDYLKLSLDEFNEQMKILQSNLNFKKQSLNNYKSVYSNNGNAKKIRCIDNDMIFNCIKEASEYFDISQSSLSQNLKGTTKKCKSKKLNTFLRFEYLPKPLSKMGTG